MERHDVALEPAAHSHAALLENLLELYSHDLSDVFSLEPGVDGRFGYEKLPLYWTEPKCRFPFLIRAGARLAGFACRLHGIDVYTYLVDVLQRVGQHPAARVAELSPRKWKLHFAATPLRSALHTLAA